MPRTLDHPQPSSTVARLLDAHAAARATTAQPHVPPAPGASFVAHDDIDVDDAPGPRVREVKRELNLSPNTDRVFTQLVELYRAATGARLSASQLARAMLLGMSACLPGLEREATRIGALRLPSNARGHAAARQVFEQRLARAFVAGMRALSPLDSG